MSGTSGFAQLLAGGLQEDSQYKETVDLPQTKFSMKANSVTREPEIQKLWEQKQVLQKLLEKNAGVSISLQLLSVCSF